VLKAHWPDRVGGETMVIIRLNLFGASVPRRKPAPTLFSSANLSRAYFPGWWLLCSLLFHGITSVGIFYFSVPYMSTELPRFPNHNTVRDLSRLRVVLYLPLLSSGGQGLGLPQRTMETGRQESPVAPPPSTRGMTYPGPQPIVSDVPRPTNRIQTVLQPALKKPPTLKPPMSLPNVVQTANAGPVVQSTPQDAVKPAAQQPTEQPAVQPEVKAAEPAPPTPIDTSKVVLPARFSSMPLPRIGSPDIAIGAPVVQDLSFLQQATPPEPPPEPVKQPETEPPPQTAEKLKELPTTEISPLLSRGTDARNLLSLTPTPALPEQLIEIPPGEARGRFAISPDPTPTASETEPGSKAGNPPTAAESRSIITAPTANAAAGNAGPVITISFGASAAAPKEAGPAGGGAGTDATRVSVVGSAPGPGAGSGSGTGSGHGKSPFAGITIVGGVRGTGASANTNSPTPAPRPLQTTYGLYIVSTEHSGGGLPSFGVFSNEQVYTVYLDMRRTEVDTAPSWTLEFAVPHGTAAQVNPDKSTDQSQQGLVLPFPAVKERPALPAELVRMHLGRMLIVYAIINTEGKMEQVSVKQSPDGLLNEFVLNAFSKWVFRPAVLNGEPVPVKVLLGIPLWLPE